MEKLSKKKLEEYLNTKLCKDCIAKLFGVEKQELYEFMEKNELGKYIGRKPTGRADKIETILHSRTFNKFIDGNKLIITKTEIARHFKISLPTLYDWMRKNDYGWLIGKEPDKLASSQKMVGKRVKKKKITEGNDYTESGYGEFD